MRRYFVAGLLVFAFLAKGIVTGEESVQSAASKEASATTAAVKVEAVTPAVVKVEPAVPSAAKVEPAAQKGVSKKVIKLLAPQTNKGMPLMVALKNRKSGREFSTQKLSDQTLSNLLWAAFGINRPETGSRTAPSAVNWQEIDIYVALPEGLYLYDANANMLLQMLPQDIRALTGKQPFVKSAPLNLIYVADLSKMGRSSEMDKNFYAAADTGFISENVYLFCASEGLSTVVRGLFDKEGLAGVMNLRPEQKIILTQTVGYPKK